MTVGQFATPYWQIRRPLLVAALIVAFGIGLLTGLVASRTVGQGTPTAATVSAVQQPSAFTVPLAGVPAAARQGIGAQDFRGPQDFRAAQDSQPAGVPAAARQGIGAQEFRGARDFQRAQDSQSAPGFGGP